VSYIPLPSVTVLIACYNGSRYIDECLKSLINQQDNQYKLQIICCDDSSTDDSYNFLLSYQEKLPNLITVIKNEKNLGSSLTRARLISCVQTQYFCFCDIDDFYYPNSIKYLLKKSKKGTCDIVTAKTYRIIGKKKRV
jgi:glycosyltransferase involved in cell wall biosynthesis